MEGMRRAAPKEFSPAATPKKELELIVEGDTFHWKAR